VELKLTGTKNMATVKAYLDGKTNEMPREVLQAVDIATSFHLYQCVPFFFRTSSFPL
jgi:hypothetical protein